MDGMTMPAPPTTAPTVPQLRLAITELLEDANTCERCAQKGNAESGRPYDAWSLAYFDSRVAAFRAVAAMLQAQVDAGAE